MSSYRTWRDTATISAFLVLLALAGAFVFDGATAATVLLAASVIAVVAARGAGYSTSSLGLERASLWNGVRLGLLVSAAIVGVVVIAALLPFSRSFFEDARFDDLGGAELAFELGIRIPLITALSEELLFRSVLLAVLMARASVKASVIASSLLFGLWHVPTTIGDLDGNEATDSLAWWGSALSVGAVVLVTGLAGVGFAWMRLRSGSVAAPWLAHLTINASTFAAGAVIAET